jgi:hypothetical protein
VTNGDGEGRPVTHSFVSRASYPRHARHERVTVTRLRAVQSVLALLICGLGVALLAASLAGARALVDELSIPELAVSVGLLVTLTPAILRPRRGPSR